MLRGVTGPKLMKFFACFSLPAGRNLVSELLLQ